MLDRYKRTINSEPVPVGYAPIAFLVLIAELAVARFPESDLELVPEPCPWWQVASTAAMTEGARNEGERGGEGERDNESERDGEGERDGEDKSDSESKRDGEDKSDGDGERDSEGERVGQRERAGATARVGEMARARRPE